MSVRANGRIADPPRHGAARIVVGAALVVAAVAVAWMARAGPGVGPQGWVAVHDVPERGQVVSSSFALAAVSVPQSEVLWPASREPAGHAARTITAGEPLLAADLVGPPSHHRVTLPVDPQNLPADLLPGDAVDVWSGGDPVPLVEAAVVQSVSPPDLGPGRVEIAVVESEVASAVRAAATDRLILVRLP